MAKERPTEEMNVDLQRADNTLHSINDQMSAMNDIRAKLEDGYESDALLDYIETFLKMAVKTKADTLKQIERLHLELAERHMKLTSKWEFVYIGENKDE